MDLFESQVRIIEKEYVGKDGTPKTSKEIKFNDLGVGAYILVEKTYKNTMVQEGKKKDGTPFTVNKTLVKYNNQDVMVNISPKAAEKWNELPNGMVRVSKVEFQGEDGTYHTYNFENV